MRFLTSFLSRQCKLAGTCCPAETSVLPIFSLLSALQYAICQAEYTIAASAPGLMPKRPPNISFACSIVPPLYRAMTEACFKQEFGSQGDVSLTGQGDEAYIDSNNAIHARKANVRFYIELGLASGDDSTTASDEKLLSQSVLSKLYSDQPA
jgi:hypothetical protein